MSNIFIIKGRQNEVNGNKFPSYTIEDKDGAFKCYFAFRQGEEIPKEFKCPCAVVVDIDITKLSIKDYKDEDGNEKTKVYAPASAIKVASDQSILEEKARLKIEQKFNLNK